MAVTALLWACLQPVFMGIVTDGNARFKALVEGANAALHKEAAQAATETARRRLKALLLTSTFR